MNLKHKSIEIILKNQHPEGSYIASPSFDTYKYCWMRDGSFIAYSMDIAGHTESAGRFFDWADKVISGKIDSVSRIINIHDKGEQLLNSDFLPARYNMDGSDTNDEWPNFQLDGYGTWLWALCRHIEITRKEQLIVKYIKSIRAVIDYLISFWNTPCYDCWEENGDKIHTSTLACIYGGLSSISAYLKEPGISAAACAIKEYILDKCIENNRLIKFSGSDEVDSSLLWVALPFNVLDVFDKIMQSTVLEIEKRLLHNSGVHRYFEDTYYGGGEWLLLSCWLGWYYAEAARKNEATEILRWVESHADKDGGMPEQILEHVYKFEYISKWKELWGEPAKPLLWSHAMYLILLGRLGG
jgi:Glucoamylase and related glycosyl hydrolases